VILINHDVLPDDSVSVNRHFGTAAAAVHALHTTAADGRVPALPVVVARAYSAVVPPAPAAHAGHRAATAAAAVPATITA
jgi:hypothetical protein